MDSKKEILVWEIISFGFYEWTQSWVLCQLMLSSHKLPSFTLTWFHTCQMAPNVVQLRLVEVYLSIPSNHFWHLKRASSKVRCSCLEDRIEPAPHSSCCHASGSVGIRCVAEVDHTPSVSFSTYQELLHLMKLWTSCKSYVHKNDARLPDQNDRNLERILRTSSGCLRHN